MIDTIFGKEDNTIEVCSGMIRKYNANRNSEYFTVDINPETNPDLVDDAQNLSSVPKVHLILLVHLIPSATLNAAIFSLAGAMTHESTARLSAMPSTAWRIESVLAAIIAVANPIQASTETVIDSDCTRNRNRATNPPTKIVISPTN
jgi:hypothetical protein